MSVLEWVSGIGERIGQAGAPVVAVVRLAGVVAPPGGPLGRRGLNLAGQAAIIERAFKLRRLKAVALAINSPGGSAVQSALIHARIRQLSREKDVPVYAFCEDVAASGGYWLACAADEIYADAGSIVGSIGVITSGFGLKSVIERLGVERRVHTAGDKKSFLDPFFDEKPAEVKRLKAIQSEMHDGFTAMVRERRGERLKADDKTLFSGEFWLGGTARELGLVDALGDLRGVMRAKYGDKVRLRVMTPERGWLARRFGIGAALPWPTEALGPVAGWGDEALAAVEERLLWSRFGL